MGFFTSTELIKKTKIKIDPNQLQTDCLKCQLYKKCRSPKIKVSGEGRKRILIINNFPTDDDDKYNTVLIEEEGKVIQNALREINVSLNRDCWKIQAVSCKPPDGRVPSHKEIKCCYPNVEKTIRTLKPKLILLLGPIAITSLFGEDFSNREVDRWRSYEIPDEKFECYVMCLHSPYQLLKNEKDNNLKSVFKRDIKRVSHCLKVTYEKQMNFDEYVTILRDFKAVKNVLKRILRKKTKIAFDYETTGLKPFRKGHKIVSIGIAVSTKKAFAFPFNYKSYWTTSELKDIKELWQEILLDKEIKKICHNIKFEDVWSAVMLERPKGWHWDTMMAEHCFPKEVEFLTFNGWKSCKNITMQDNVAQLDLQTKEISYDKPVKLIKSKTNELLYLKSKILNFCCTPNHDMIKSFRGSNRLEKISVENIIKTTEADFLGAGNIQENSSIFTDNSIQLFAAILADGYFMQRDRGTGNKIYGIGFSVKKERKINRIEELLKVERLKYSKSIRKDKATAIKIHNTEYAKMFEKLFPEKLLNFPFESKLGLSQLKLFLEEFNFFDGAYIESIKWHRSITIPQHKKQNIDVLQSMFCKIGYRCRAIFKNRQTNFGKSKQYIITANKKDHFTCQFKSAEIKIKKEQKNVYCVTTKKGTLITRYKGHVLVMGNCIDNRKASTGLKFQTFVKYGVRPYDKVIAPFLKAKDGEFNTVEKAPFKELLIYNGLDCIFSMMRYKAQKAYLPHMEKMFEAYKFFMRGTQTMGTIQLNGICVDMEYFKNTEKELGIRIKKLKKYLTDGREAQKFKNQFHRDININSNQDLGKLFFEILGKKGKLTEAGNYKTDKVTLEKLNLPFVDKLAEMKRLEKAKGTYLAQFIREECNGLIHPFFDLHIPISYRSASSMPNFQNIPIRVPEIGKLIRTGIIPDDNCVLSEIDFSGAEVITSACVVGDTLIETTEGSKTIKHIIERIKNHKVYTFGYSLEEKRIKIAPITAGGITGINKEVWKVTLDNGKIIKATPDHKFMIRYGSKHEGKYIELKDLSPGMSLMPFYKKRKGNYHYVNLNNRKGIGVHTLIGIDIFKKDVGKTCGGNVIHHKKGFSNKISNLEFMTRKDHTSLHHKGKITGPHSEEHKAKISKAIKGVPCPQRGNKQTEEQKRKLSLRMTGREVSESNREKLSKAKKEYWKNKEKVKCKVCGKLFRSITNTHLLNAHNMTLNEYAEYNHKVVSIEFYGYEDVYNINVEGVHNYATSAGAIIKNCYHHDPQFIHDITKGDMHRDLAIELFMLSFDLMDKTNSNYNKEQLECIKKIRFFAKNQWTFAQFYGDWFGSCAPNLWETVVESELKITNGKTVKEHLEEKGIYELGEMIDGRPTEGSFLEHCKDVEERMWNERFPLYTQWKKDIVEFYQKHGFIETYLGFRFQGYMDKKQCTNYPIQGTSFHLLVYTLIHVDKFIKKHNLKTKLIGQIHDSLIANVPKDEIVFYHKGVTEIVSSLKNKFKWLTIPMEIEIELSKLKEDGGNFAEMTEYTMKEITEMYKKEE